MIGKRTTAMALLGLSFLVSGCETPKQEETAAPAVVHSEALKNETPEQVLCDLLTQAAQGGHQISVPLPGVDEIYTQAGIPKSSGMYEVLSGASPLEPSKAGIEGYLADVCGRPFNLES